MADDTFEVENKLFDKLTGLGESLLGEALAKVLKKVGVMSSRDRTSGWMLLKLTQDFLWETRPAENQVVGLKESMHKVVDLVQHAQRYSKTRSCFCKDLVSGEHAADPVCSVCALNSAEGELKRALK